MHFPADNLAAVQVNDQIQVKRAAGHRCRQIGHVPAPDLARRRGDMRGWRPRGRGRRDRGGHAVRARKTRAKVDSLAR